MAFSWFRVLSYLSVVGLLSLAACSKPSLIGSDLLPSGDAINLEYRDDFSLTVTTVAGDSVETTNQGTLLCGKVEDPQFGISEAWIYTQVRLAVTAVDFNGGTLDSVVLSLVYNNAKPYMAGDTTAPQTWRVERISEDLAKNTNYYSNRTFTTSDVLASGFTFVPALSDSLFLLWDSSEVAPQLRIPLDMAFGQSLFAPADTTIYDNDTNFKEFFKGLVIKPESGGANSAILRFNFEHPQTKLTLYYRDADNENQAFDFKIDASAINVNHFTHNYAGTSIFDPSEQGDRAFVQGMGGASTRININDLLSLGTVIINKAELEVSIADTSDFALFPAVTSLALTRQDADGEAYLIYDLVRAVQFSSLALFGGEKEGEEIGGVTYYRYRMNVTGFLQEALAGKYDYNALYLTPLAEGERPNRVIIAGENNTLNGGILQPKLTVVYSTIPE